MHDEKTFTAEGNRALKQRLVEEGRAHAALVFDGDEAVAWCQYGSPAGTAEIYHRKEYEASGDAPPDYRITCMFVDKKYRRKGVTRPPSVAPRADRAGRRRGRRGVPARQRRQEGVRPLQRHTVPLRAGRVQLRPPQGHEELRDAQGCCAVKSTTSEVMGDSDKRTVRTAARVVGWITRKGSRSSTPRRRDCG